MALSPGELQRLSDWLDELLDLPEGEAREQRLATIGQTDPALRDRLSGLLSQAAEGSDDALDALPGLARALGDRQGTGPSGGQRIGPYALLRPLGEGGMGSVWLARRVEGELRREVALKLPRLAGAPGSFARRFERERDILSALEHPLIARLYEAGSAPQPGGGEQPWLAMEFVDGRPLGDYCDSARMDLRARVQLFLQVLQAVQFAHGRLVVHRDLKPGNILVTATGQVRLLDFGVAKLLDAAGDDATELAAAPMTPMYASPEQVARRPVGIASDIYSLGVVLYELLTGRHPYRLARDTRGALEQAILDADLTRPSRSTPDAQAAARRGCVPDGLRRQLRGDLDTIVLRAMGPTPEQRYATAQALEDDLRRWLAHEPVRAHPDSWHYRLGKFCRRHALPLGAAGVATLGLVLGLALALDQARWAEREARRTQAVQDFLIGMVRDVGPGRAQGRPLTVAELLEHGERRLARQLGGEPELRAAITDALIELHLETSDGRRSVALAEQRLALAVAQSGEGSLAHGDALLLLGRAQVVQGRYEPALDTLARARQIFLAHPGQREDGLLSVDNRSAGALNALLRHDEAIALLRQLIPRLQARWPGTHWDEVNARFMLATALASEGRREEALRLVSDLEPVLARGWPEQGFGLAAMQANLGYVLWRQRAFDQAATALQGAMAEMDRLLGPVNSPAVDAGRTLGMVQLDAGRYDRAGAVLEANLERSRAMHGPQDAEFALNLSFAVLSRLRLMRLDEAEAAAREPIAIIGLGCRVPGGGNDAQSFWALMRDGVDAIGPLPADRWNVEATYDPDPDAVGRIATHGGGFLSDVRGFDQALFGITRREAQGMDPQQRLLLEVAWEALENAGQAPDRLEHTPTGVYLGMAGCDYAFLQLQTRDPQLLDAHFASGMAHSVASGRLSYLLGLQGPAVTIDTACSSSLTAIHLACQSLRTG
ncbi:MAG: protein kinase, partial [Burkholderiales bacterium]|nr:protein kinase [Burkholderiales bacterium]